MVSINKNIIVSSKKQYDNLPHRDEDSVLTLYAHYFLVAELMRKNFTKLRAKLEQRGHLSQNDSVDLRIYACTWLGFLGVICEGFKKLNIRLLLLEARPLDFRELIPRSDEIGKAIKQHADPLREFRNSIFHLRSDVAASRKFFENKTSRIKWAEELHVDFRAFFSEYRILCEFHYAMSGRTSEMQADRSRCKNNKLQTII